jgi:hypothetical protein
MFLAKTPNPAKPAKKMKHIGVRPTAAMPPVGFHVRGRIAYE